MTRLNSATTMASTATAASPETSVSRPARDWPANRLAAQMALEIAERRKAAKRADLYDEIAERILHEARHALLSEEDLYVAAYQALRGQGKTLWTHDCHLLRAATRRAWSAFDPGEVQLPPATSPATSHDGIEEAATAAAESVSDSPARNGSTAAVSGTPDGSARSFSPVVGAGDRPDYFAIGCAISRAQYQTLSDLVAPEVIR